MSPATKCRVLASVAILSLSLLSMGPSGATDPAKREPRLYCPVTGLPKHETCECPSAYCSLQPNTTKTVMFEGGQVRFCCGKCKALFEKTPAKFAVAARHQLAATGQARQVKCPQCGGEPNKAHSRDVFGVTVLFCTAECQTAAARDDVEAIFNAKAFRRAFEVTAAK